MGSTAFMLVTGCSPRKEASSVGVGLFDVDYSYGTRLPEAKGFTACSQGLSEATPLEIAPYDASRQGCQQRFSFVGNDDRCDERRWHTLRSADTLVGNPGCRSCLAQPRANG